MAFTTLRTFNVAVPNPTATDETEDFPVVTVMATNKWAAIDNAKAFLVGKGLMSSSVDIRFTSEVTEVIKDAPKVGDKALVNA